MAMYRIMRSDGVLEIERNSLRSALTYIRVVLGAGSRERGVTYTLQSALLGDWRILREVV